MQEIPAMTQDSLVRNLDGMTTIHQRIKAQRERLELSMEQLADRVGVAWQTVQQWENGKTAPKRARLDAVAAALNTTPEYLAIGPAAAPPQGEDAHTAGGDAMSFQERISLAFTAEGDRRAAAGEVRLTKSELWKSVGATSAAATHWFNGSNGMDLDTCVKAARVLRVNPRWLFDGTGPMTLEGGSEKVSQSAGLSLIPGGRKPPEVEIPQFETGGAMGAGLELRDQPGVIQAWHVSSEWLRKNVPSYTQKENLCIVTGFGDSMRPLFNPGDPLVVDRGVRTVDFDAVYFFRVGSQGFIKRLQTIPTESGFVIRAKSENTKYDSWDITEKMEFEVFGRVLKVWCSQDF